jgi:hypothetical protein
MWLVVKRGREVRTGRRPSVEVYQSWKLEMVLIVDVRERYTLGWNRKFIKT